jgi:hypothetical protein
VSGISPGARAAFGAAHVAGHFDHHGRFGHRRFFGGGFGGYDSSCYDWVSGPYGWACQWPYED